MSKSEFLRAMQDMTYYLNQGDSESASDLFFDIKLHMENGGQWFLTGKSEIE